MAAVGRRHPVFSIDATIRTVEESSPPTPFPTPSSPPPPYIVPKRCYLQAWVDGGKTAKTTTEEGEMPRGQRSGGNGGRGRMTAIIAGGDVVS